MRNLFYAIGIPLVLLFLVLGYFYHGFFWVFIVLGPLFLIGIYDVIQKKHTILRNFPILGHIRYMFEFISPELKQYFVEREEDGRPIPRNERNVIYQRAKGVDDTHPFGTQLDINNGHYEGLRHSIYPTPVLKEAPRVLFGGKDCIKPYSASIYNISAMSFGALSGNAIRALNRGAKVGGFYHNTGEGGLSKYHIMEGGDIVWQIGTAYFGCRTQEGDFDEEKFKINAVRDQVKMIELKISQGAKPGHGGVLPAAKNSPEIAEARGIEPHTVVISPPGHSAFSDAKGLLYFIKKLRDLSGGKPVGFKLCIGKPEEFREICRQMIETGITPDFITVDGAEGGTGASPIEFTDSVGIPIEPALNFVNKTLIQFDLRKEMRLIASGKVYTGIGLMRMFALGADTCNAARGFMMSIGCIQAVRCNTNKCPTGITTQDPKLTRGLVVDEKYKRCASFHKKTVEITMELMAGCGLSSLEEIDSSIFIRNDEFANFDKKYFSEDVAV